jgi:hypothetical protein
MGKLNFSTYLAAEQGRLLNIEHLRLDMGNTNDLPQMIVRTQQQSRDNLKLYNYSIKDVEEAATETVPWQ